MFAKYLRPYNSNEQLNCYYYFLSKFIVAPKILTGIGHWVYSKKSGIKSDMLI